MKHETERPSGSRRRACCMIEGRYNLLRILQPELLFQQKPYMSAM